MDKESIITLCIAVYGALLSTYQWIDSVLARKRTIKIEIAKAALAHRVGPLQPYIVITIRNPGNRSVTINQPIVQIPDKSQVIFHNAIYETTFPHTIEDGKCCRVLINPQELEDSLIAKGYNRKCKIRATVTDALGKKYRSGAFVVDPKKKH
jgi:hypothetical protein